MGASEKGGRNPGQDGKGIIAGAALGPSPELRIPSPILVGQTEKNLPAMQETSFRALGQKGTCSRKWQPTLVVFPGKSHGQRSLVGYSPWGHKESYKAKQHTPLSPRVPHCDREEQIPTPC